MPTIRQRLLQPRPDRASAGSLVGRILPAISVGYFSRKQMVAERVLSSRLVGSQVFVFHFPSVIHDMKGSMTNQIPERPFRHLASHLAL